MAPHLEQVVAAGGRRGIGVSNSSGDNLRSGIGSNITVHSLLGIHLSRGVLRRCWRVVGTGGTGEPERTSSSYASTRACGTARASKCATANLGLQVCLNSSWNMEPAALSHIPVSIATLKFNQNCFPVFIEHLWFVKLNYVLPQLHNHRWQQRTLPCSYPCRSSLTACKSYETHHYKNEYPDLVGKTSCETCLDGDSILHAQLHHRGW